MILLELNGVSKYIYLHDDKIVIKEKGILRKLIQPFFNIDKTIYLTQISSINVIEGNALAHGYIQFTLLSKKKNILLFTRKHYKLAEKIKFKIEEIKTPMENLMEQQSIEQIVKYKQLFDDGIITELEFNIKKKELSNL